jgi:hypothetical protein
MNLARIEAMAQRKPNRPFFPTRPETRVAVLTFLATTLASVFVTSAGLAQGAVIERAHIAGKPGHRDVLEIRLATDNAGRLDWNRRDNRVVFDRPNADGFYDIYQAHSDGLVDRCITCDNYSFHKMHLLDPVVDPAGKLIVVQVQANAKRLKQGIIEMALPLRGVHSELWAVTMDGKVAWQLTQLQQDGHAVLGAVFSNEADHILWRERLSTRGDRLLGHWATRIAEWSIRRGTPRLGKVSLIAAGAGGFDLAQEFTPDDQGILVARLPAGAGEGGLDLVRIDLDSRDVVSLTRTPGVRDDVGRYSPDSQHIVWASGQGIKPLSPDERRLPWRSDLWIMRADGSEQQRLTFWNDPESDHQLGQALITDLAWGPEGDQLLVSVVSAGIEIEQAIWRVTLAPSYRRSP